MPYIFHQNMRNYGGGLAPGGVHSPKTLMYAFHLNAIRLSRMPDNPIAAGFTEITNNLASAAALAPLSATLNLVFRCNIMTRRTAFGGREWIGLASVGPGAPVSYGRLSLQVDHQGVNILHDIAPVLPGAAGFTAWSNSLPHGYTLDYQSLVYMVMAHGGVNIAVGFLHNIYSINDARGLYMQNLPRIAAEIVNNNPAMPAGGTVYFGGDFNVVPQRRRQRNGITLDAFWAGTVAPPAGFGVPANQVFLAPQAAYPHSNHGGTTLSGSLYDYWMTNAAVAGGLPQADIEVRTMDCRGGGAAIPGMAGLMSDHCGSVLRI